jgi:hypothetical protein
MNDPTKFFCPASGNLLVMWKFAKQFCYTEYSHGFDSLSFVQLARFNFKRFHVRQNVMQ